MLLVAAVAGCGSTYRPVVTPISPTGPAPQPSSNVLVTTATPLSSGGYNQAAAGLANVFDGPGDTLIAQAQLGNGPLGVVMNSSGSLAATANSDGTLNSFEPASGLRASGGSNPVFSSTLLQGSTPINMTTTTANLFITLKNVPAVGILTGAATGVFSLIQELPVAASPINFAGTSTAQRIYAISQDNGSNKVAYGDCENPSQVTTPGQAAAIETSTLTISATLPVGICPVYGIGSTDNYRIFVLNRGSGTVTVINSQFNKLDTTPNIQNLNPATGALTLPPPAGFTGTFNAGPVFADFYAPSAQLVTANYDSNTISVINTSLDVYGNDSSLFGQTVTIPVGNGPAAVTILRDGSRAYVANQKDSTVSVVNLTTFHVDATIPVTGHPISIASIFSTPFGQVYVVSSDQPYMTVIRTDTNTVSATVQLDGVGVDVHSTTQAVGTSTSVNAVTTSHASGSGAPCGYGAPYVLTSGPCSTLK